MLYRFLSMMALFCCSPHAFSYATYNLAPLPPTRNETANPLHWVELSNAESVAFFAPADQILSQNHPIRVRLQSWSDALYAQLERRWPGRFRGIEGKIVLPRPIIRIERNTKPEAHVSAATICYAVKVKFAATTSHAIDHGSGVPQVLLISDKGTVGVFEKSKVSCIDRMDRDVSIEAVRELIGSVRCDVHVEDWTDDGSQGQTLVIGRDCKVPSSVAATDIKGIMLRSMAQEVTMTTGLFAIMPNEGALLYTVLHELAHYFRSHSLVNKQEFQYFYHRDGASEHLAQPVRDPSLVPLGQRLLKIPHVRTQPIPGQQWHSEMFSYGRYLFTALIEPACTDNSASCHADCLSWTGLMKDQARLALLGRFPQARLMGEALATYREWERSLTQCLTSVPSELVPMSEVKKVFWRADLPQEVGPQWRLVDAARSMNEKMFRDSEINDQILTEALKENLGYYTTEEEADNLAFAWLSLVGVPATAAFDHWWAFATYFDANTLDSPLNFGLGRCRELYDSKPRWTDRGRQLRVPIGSFSDPHHSTCYRIWNLDQRRGGLWPEREKPPIAPLDFELLKKMAADAL